MIYNDEFVSIEKMHALLIKKRRTIDDENVLTISYRNDYFVLQRQRVNVRLRNDIEIFDIDDDTIFAFVVCVWFSYAKHWIKKRRRFVDSKHFVDNVQFVENFVD